MITKDRIFKKATPVRHMTELCTEIREKRSEDSNKCSEQILLLCTDGSGVMCILNYTLQHCALEREKMGENYENKMRNKNMMNEVQQMLERCPEFKEHFSNLMEPVKSLFKKRFQNMKTKEDYIECASLVLKDEIDECFDIIHLIDETIKKDKLSPQDVESSE